MRRESYPYYVRRPTRGGEARLDRCKKRTGEPATFAALTDAAWRYPTAPNKLAGQLVERTAWHNGAISSKSQRNGCVLSRTCAPSGQERLDQGS